MIFLLQLKYKAKNHFYSIYKKTNFIIFPRNSKSHRNNYNSQGGFFKKSHLESHLSISDFFIPILEKDNKKIIYVSEEVNNFCFSVFKKRSKRLFISPSSGFLTINFFMQNKIFKNYEKHLVGFTFKGWKGHPWKEEKLFLYSEAKNNKIIIHQSSLLKRLYSIFLSKFYQVMKGFLCLSK